MSNPVSRYVNNVFNAAEKSGSASGVQNSDTALKNPSAKAKSKEAETARGQLLGALLQNRTYDEQGKIKGTQADHHVTDNNSHTQTVKPMTPAQKQGEAKRPAVGNDAAVAKKVKGPSHNNGYTN